MEVDYKRGKYLTIFRHYEHDENINDPYIFLQSIINMNVSTIYDVIKAIVECYDQSDNPKAYKEYTKILHEYTIRYKMMKYYKNKKSKNFLRNNAIVILKLLLPEYKLDAIKNAIVENVEGLQNDNIIKYRPFSNSLVTPFKVIELSRNDNEILRCYSIMLLTLNNPQPDSQRLFNVGIPCISKVINKFK